MCINVKIQDDQKGDVRLNVILRSFHVTIVTLEKAMINLLNPE